MQDSYILERFRVTFTANGRLKLKNSQKENGRIQTAENNSRQVKGKLGNVSGTNSIAVWHKLTLNLSIDCKITLTITVNN